MENNLQKYQRGFNFWSAELEKYDGKKWPYVEPREIIAGMVKIWRGYLECAGIIKREINDTN